MCTIDGDEDAGDSDEAVFLLCRLSLILTLPLRVHSFSTSTSHHKIDTFPHINVLLLFLAVVQTDIPGERGSYKKCGPAVQFSNS